MECGNEECELRFTEEDRKKAHEWWNMGGLKQQWVEPPICWAEDKDTEYCPGYKEMNMLAKDVKPGDWFMVKRSRTWYKKVRDTKAYAVGTQIGVLTDFMIPADEEVEVRSKK
jgi:hypothetical protein